LTSSGMLAPSGIRRPKFSENPQQLDIICHAGLQSHPRPRSGPNKVAAGIGGHARSHTCTGPYSSLACLVHFGTHSARCGLFPCPFGVGLGDIVSAIGTVNLVVSAHQLRRRPIALRVRILYASCLLLGPLTNQRLPGGSLNNWGLLRARC
jgi:hypothetical protein